MLTEDGWMDSDNNGILDKNIEGKMYEFAFTFICNDNPYRKKYCRFFASTFVKYGINANVKVVSWEEYLNRIKSGDFEAYYGAWSVSILPPDPSLLWHSSATTSDANPIHFVNKESDELLDKYNREYDESERIEILKQWQQIIYDEQPYTFLYSNKARYVYNNRFETDWNDSSKFHNFSKWWVKKENQKYGKK